MSAWSPRASSVSASTAGAPELDKTFRVDSLSASMRGRTSGTEDVARVLQSEREYWSRKCLQQVGGEVEKAMQMKAGALESSVVEKAKESLMPFIEEAVAGLQGRILRSLHQELEVQRAEWEAQRARQAQAEAAALAAQAEARCAAQLDALRATVGELRSELREQRRQICALAAGPERPGQHPLRSPAPAPSDPGQCGADPSADCACAVPVEPQEPAPAAAPKFLSVAGPSAPRLSAASAEAEMPRLLGRGRAPSPVRPRLFAARPESSVGPGARARPAATDGGGAMPDGLKESLKHMVSAVQRTLGDLEADRPCLEEGPQQEAPRHDEQDPAPSRVLSAAPVPAAAAPTRAAGAQQPRGAPAPLVPPLSLVAVHPARQVVVHTPRTARGFSAAPLVRRP